MNIVMLVKNRPQLTHQSLVSLLNNTAAPWNLTIVDDGSERRTQDVLSMFAAAYRKRVLLLHIAPDRPEAGIIGKLKNIGAACSRDGFGQGDWLYFSDNDVYFLNRWDATLMYAAETVESSDFRLLGGQNHPYHLPINGPPCDLGANRFVYEYAAVAGSSWLMRWQTYDGFGPLDGNARGTYQSEDTAYCQRIRTAGYRVGAIEPHVVLDTGLTQTDGYPSIGKDAKPRVPGVHYV